MHDEEKRKKTSEAPPIAESHHLVPCGELLHVIGRADGGVVTTRVRTIADHT